MLTTGQHGPSPLMFQRALHTPADLQDHALRVGIRLHENFSSRSNTIPCIAQTRGGPAAHDFSGAQGSGSHGNKRIKSSPLYHRYYQFSSPGATPEYIQNVITPLSFSDSSHTRTPVTSNNLQIERRADHKHNTAERRHKSAVSMPAAVQHAPHTTKEYLPVPQPMSQYDAASSRDSRSVCSSESRWSRSAQAQRFITEQQELTKTKNLKKSVEMRSHRVDKLYYMRGSAVPIKPRYHIGDTDMRRLQQLKQMHLQNKKQFRYSYSGLRRAGQLYSGEESDADGGLLRQPPPSSVTGYTTADDRTVHTRDADSTAGQREPADSVIDEPPEVTAASEATQIDTNSQPNTLPEVRFALDPPPKTPEISVPISACDSNPSESVTDSKAATTRSGLASNSNQPTNSIDRPNSGEDRPASAGDRPASSATLPEQDNTTAPNAEGQDVDLVAEGDDAVHNSETASVEHSDTVGCVQSAVEALVLSDNHDTSGNNKAQIYGEDEGHSSDDEEVKDMKNLHDAASSAASD